MCVTLVVLWKAVSYEGIDRLRYGEVRRKNVTFDF
jgi:hypothetical protein